MSNASSTSLPSGPASQDVGSAFDKEDSPLMRHLVSLGDRSPSIVGLIQTLRDHTRNTSTRIGMRIKGVRNMDQRNIYDHYYGNDDEDYSLVDFIDISLSNGVSKSYSLESKPLYQDSNLIPQRINHALARLKESTTEIHTRLIMLNTSYQDDPLIIETLLNLHILVMELEIPPACAVRFLRPPMSIEMAEQLNDFDVAASPILRTLSLGPGEKLACFGKCIPWDVSAMDLGERGFGGQKFHVVVVRSDGRQFGVRVRGEMAQWMRKFRSYWTSLENDPSMDWVGGLTVNDLQKFMDMDTVHSRSSHVAVSTDPASRWINAILRVLIFRYSVRPRSATFRMRLNDTEYDNECERAAALHQAAKMDLFRIENFLTNRGQQTILNCGPPLEAFRVLVDELRSEDESLSTGFERRSTLRSLDMARLSIKESSGTIRLTWLATAFIPISLASSIFGMNVREIDSETTGIWQFIVTATALLAASAYSWCLMRACHNIRPCLRSLPSFVGFWEWVSVPGAVWIKLRQRVGQQEFGQPELEAGKQETVLYLLGFKRLNDDIP